MKKKLSILLIVTVMLFAFVPALTLAQDEETADYATVEEYLAALEENEMLSTVEKITLERNLSSYEENLSMDSITSVVDKVLAEEIDLGQGFVILNNLEESTVNGYNEEKALEMINSYQNQENSGQLAFQTALELRKMSREDLSGEQTDAFSDQIASIIEENGEIETSELKQLAAEYRKEAREEEREQRKIAKSERGNSASQNALENGKANKASEKALNKDNNGKGNNKGNGNNSKAKDKGNGNSSGKSSNSNAKK